jgi:methyl-accepting chemotaxis protein
MIMNFQTSADKDLDERSLPAFPARFLTIIILLSAAALITIIAISYFTHNTAVELQERSVAVAKVQGDITYQDEALTMSARMAATTGDERWSERYNSHVEPMDKALKAAVALAPAEAQRAFVTATSKANDRLIELETEAIQRARSGNTNSATSIMNSPEYDNQKSILSNGLARFEAAINQSISGAQAKLDNYTKIAVVIRLLIFCAIGLSWWYFLRILNIWRGEMTLIIAQEQAISDENRRQQAIIDASSLQNRRLLEETVQRVESENKTLNEAAREQDRRANLRLADTFEAAIGNIVGELARSSNNLVTTARNMQGAARDADSQFVEVTSAIEKTSANMLAVAATTDQMLGSVRSASTHATKSANHVLTATGEAADLIERVRDLADTADQIGNIVGMIDSIANQTNLLALNATIEASRAGDAGRGFAVVAHEVKSLAAQTAQATAEIAALIAKVQAGTKYAVDSGNVAAASMGQIQTAAEAINDTLSEQHDAIANLAVRTTSVVSSNEQMVIGVEGVSQAARNAGAASGEVLDTAHVLAQQTDRLKAELEAVVSRLRAA